MVIDFKYTLQIINEILLENKGDSTIMSACKTATEDIKEQLSLRKREKDDVERSREFILYRARTILNLCRDVRVFQENQSEDNNLCISNYSLLIDIVNKKILDEQLKEENERGVR